MTLETTLPADSELPSDESESPRLSVESAFLALLMIESASMESCLPAITQIWLLDWLIYFLGDVMFRQLRHAF